MKVETYKCDQCGKLRSNDSNHWLLALEFMGSFRLCAWDRDVAKEPDASHLCGEKCAHAAVDKYLAELRTGSAQKNLHSTIDVGASVS